MRDCDHRFEWTQAEFRQWADGLGDTYGYEVEYTGVGKAVGDEAGPMGAAVGYASQMAVFTRRGDDKRQYEPAGVQPADIPPGDIVQVFDSRDVTLQQLSVA
jgi:hypothetical protein